MATSSDHRHFMGLALERAWSEFGQGNRPIFCLIVKDDQIVGQGPNTVARDKDPSAQRFLALCSVRGTGGSAARTWAIIPSNPSSHYEFVRPLAGVKSSSAPGGIGGCFFRLSWNGWIILRIRCRTQTAVACTSVSSFGSWRKAVTARKRSHDQGKGHGAGVGSPSAGLVHAGISLFAARARGAI